MAYSTSKVAIVGCGLVGSSTAFSLLTQGVCDEIILIDINPEKALGEAKDLNNCIEYLNRNVKVRVGTYEECKDVDIVVITAGAPPKQGQTRLDTLDASVKIVKSIVEPIMKSGFDGIFINVSNPADVVAQYIYEIAGLPKNKVIGAGTALDSARLKNIIADIIHVDPRSIYAYSMGEHGDSQMVPWSLVTVGGKSFYDVIADNQELMKDVDLDELVHKTIREGWEIYERKGTTYYGIATTTAGIIKAILNDENKIIPVATMLEGEYGLKGMFLSVPCVLNRNGVADVLEVHLTNGELTKLMESAKVIEDARAQISIQ